MIDHELTDPTGSALTITHNDDGVWITTTQDREEVTVGPFPPRALRASFDMSGDLMDGGVTAAAIEAEVVSPERARSLVQERNEAKAEAAMCQTSLRGQIRRAEQAEDTLLMVQQQRDHLRAALATTARQRDEADKRAATASPRPLSADDITNDARDRGREAYWTWRDEGSGSINGLVRAILHAALPEPVRPEGAEEIEGPLRQVLRLNGQAPDETTVSALSDALAERGVRAGGDS